MKKLCLILAYLFLFTQTAFAMPLLVGQKVVYRGTVTDLRISAVDGTAFIDNLPYTYSSDFSTGVDGWSATQGTAAGNIDSIGGEDNWLRLTVNNVSAIHGLLKSSVFTAGKKYTLTFKYYVPSGQTAVLGIVPMEQSGSSRLPGATYASGNTTDAVTTYSLTFTAATGTTGLFVAATTGSGVILQDPGGDDVFYIKDIKISEIQPYADGNHSIEIYDSSNRMLKGVLKAAGSSETLGDNPVALASFNFTSRWTTTGTASITDSDTYVSNAGGDGIRVESIFTLLSLYRSSFTGSTSTGNTTIVDFASATNIYATINDGNSYRTNVSSNVLRLRNSHAATTDITAITVQQVLTPSSSGATVVSAKGGEVYNFSYKNASFTYNASSYYVIIRAIR